MLAEFRGIFTQLWPASLAGTFVQAKPLLHHPLAYIDSLS
jgi:hypothetical protein